MRRVKRVLVALLSMVMVLMASMPVMAEGNSTLDPEPGYEAKEVNVTIAGQDSGGLLVGHTFVAYQIFKGTQNKTVTGGAHLGDVEWGAHINGGAFLEALQVNNFKTYEGAKIFNPFTDCETAKDVAYVLENYGTAGRAENQEYVSESNIQKFLDDVASLAKANLKEGATGYPLTQGKNELPSGYYLIVDETKNLGEDAVLNASVLQITDEIHIYVKTSKPELNKGILPTEDAKADAKVEYNNGAIGDEIHFVVTSNVPDMSHYHTYKFVVTDVLSKGFTLNTAVEEGKNYNSFVKITVGNKTLEPGTDFEVIVKNATEYNGLDDDTKTLYGYDSIGAGETYIRIIFKNFYENYLNNTGDAIEIRYSAFLNKDAKIGNDGNPNTARLQYWNNPDIRPDGGSDDFSELDPKGMTPEKKTYTYVTALKLTKVDAENPKNTLAGAQFLITGTKLNHTLVDGYIYVEDNENGKYYKLKDGTYTETKPEGNVNTSNYESTTQHYSQVWKSHDEVTYDKVAYNIEVGTNGVLILQGLSEGEYIFTEIKAPYGYNLLKDPIRVNITWKAPAQNSVDCEWTAEYGWWREDSSNPGNKVFDSIGSLEFGTIDIGNESIGGFAFDVMNSQGALLPRTGGIGTTIFYAVGCALVVVAGVLLVVKMRAGRKED